MDFGGIQEEYTNTSAQEAARPVERLNPVDFKKRKKGHCVIQDLTGQKYNRLTAITLSHVNNYGIAMWFCRCDCGNERIVHRPSLINGHTKSCGCLHKENTSAAAKRRANNMARKYPKHRASFGGRLKKTYGLSLVQWDTMINEQCGKCAVCRRDFTPDRGPNVDHNHETLEVRGLLCLPCNWVLGYAETDPDWLANFKAA